jgi:hypothetical protein
MPLGEFVRRFNVLVPPDALPASLLTGLNSSTASEKQAAEILLLHIAMERSSYRLGLGQVRESNCGRPFFPFPFFLFVFATAEAGKLREYQTRGPLKWVGRRSVSKLSVRLFWS